MSHLKITHLKNGTVVYDSEISEEPTFMGAGGNFGITFKAESLPSMPPTPSFASDLAWMTEEEERASYEAQHGTLNGEADQFDSFEDEPSDEEAS